jgi:hypothetical protein
MIRINRYFLALAGWACFARAPSAYAQIQEGDRVMATLGGSLAVPDIFIARCPAGQQIAGFKLVVGDRSKWGDGVFDIDPICFTALAPAVAGATGILQRDTSTQGRPYAYRNVTYLTLVCPSERPVVTKMKVEIEHEIGGAGFDYGDDPWSVNGIGLYCGLVDRPQDRHVEGPAYWGVLRVEEVGGWQAPRVEERVGQAALVREGAEWGNNTCADGLVAVGISGQAGDRVYALGLICGIPVITPGQAVKAVGRVTLDPATLGPERSICELAQQARARNSPAAPGLEARCATQQELHVADLAAKGEAIAMQDPLAVELRQQQPGDSAQRGFDIGMAAAEGHTLPGPGKQRTHDSLTTHEQAGFEAAVAFSLERNNYRDRAATGAAIAAANPAVAAMRNRRADVFYRLGFDIATAIFGDPALGAEGKTAKGPGSLAVRESLSDAGKRGFDAAADYFGIPK